MKANRFYDVMDILEEYDLALADINETFGEAMLSLAYIKFINPYSSISPSGYMPTPAFLKINT